jgi:hypothetical protein
MMLKMNFIIAKNLIRKTYITNKIDSNRDEDYLKDNNKDEDTKNINDIE